MPAVSHAAGFKIALGISCVRASNKYYPLQLYFPAIKMYLPSKMQAEYRLIKVTQRGGCGLSLRVLPKQKTPDAVHSH
jgi:hypothetical protein